MSIDQPTGGPNPALPAAVIVDDNLMFAVVVEGALRREGYAVRSLSGGASTPGDIAALAPAIVFVNLTSARYPGPALVRELRARSELAGTPIVGYAGHVETDFLHAGREAGADIVVPNSAVRAAMPEVLAKLRRRLAGAAEEDAQ